MLIFYFTCIVVLASRLSVASKASELDETLIKAPKLAGIVTLKKLDEYQVTRSELRFEENYDISKSRSKVEFSLLTFEPNYYYKQDVGNIIGVSSDGSCQAIKGKFVPELEIFIEQMLPHIDFEYELSSMKLNYAIGPTGMINSIIRNAFISMNKKISYIGKRRYRSIICDVRGFDYQATHADKTYFVKFEMYIPDQAQFGNDDPNMPVAIVVTRSTYLTMIHRNVETFQVDYMQVLDFLTDSFSKESIFNLPIAGGCSKFMPDSTHDYSTHIGHQSDAQMSLSYKNYKGQTINVAIDSSSDLFTREIEGVSRTIWDINQDIGYYIEPNFSSEKLQSDSKEKKVTKTKQCSVFKPVSYYEYPIAPFYRPYKQQTSTTKPMSPLSFLLGEPSNGLIQNFAFIRVDYIKNLPCNVYESVLTSAPAIFAFDELASIRAGQYYTTNSLVNRDLSRKEFIVTYYFYEKLNLTNKETNWWPTRISLHERIIDNNQLFLVDTLDIQTFSWSLFGTQYKPEELFDTSDCFDGTQHDRRRVEFLMSPPNVEARKKLTENRFSSEYLVKKAVAKKLMMSQLDIIDFNLYFRGQSQLVLRFTVVDGDEEKDLFWRGLNLPPDSFDYEQQLTIPTAHIEGDCVFEATLVDDANTALFCVSKDNSHSCVVVLGSKKPDIRKPDENSSTICSQFTVNEGNSDDDYEYISHVSQLLKLKPNLIGLELDILYDQEQISLKIIDYQIDAPIKLKTIPQYTYGENTIDEIYSNKHDIKYVKSANFKSISQCASLCDLDTYCKSYSFCQGVCNVANVDIQDVSQIKDEKFFEVSNELGNKLYEVRKDVKCFIRQRNYLSLYRHTDEFVELSKSYLESQLVASEFECARQAQLAEQRYPDQHFALFASCIHSSACVLDESKIYETKELEEDTETCFVHRKKYETFFHPSQKVVKLQNDESLQSMKSFPTVESCARFCWMESGKECSSFDYCTNSDPMAQSCIINKANFKDSQDEYFELRHGCYHYERDLELDKIREELDIGRHEIYNKMNARDLNKQSQTSLVFVFICIIASAIGLTVGYQTGRYLKFATNICHTPLISSNSNFEKRRRFLVDHLKFTNGSSQEDKIQMQDIETDNSMSRSLIDTDC